VFLIFCYSFASALALYWTTQNIFTIFQTWLTSKMPEPVLKEKPAGPVDPSKPQKKSFMERMMEKQEELQQQQANRNRADNSGDLRDVTPKKRPPKTGG
jgi:YidC/Oxa1 family membrane protein insertase